VKAHCTSSCPSSYLPLWGGPTPRAASGWGHVLAGLVAWPSGNPPPQRRKSAAGPPRKGEVWSLLLRHDETCGSVAATQKRPGDARSEGCGAPSGRVLFLVGSLSAPRLRHRFRPFPHLPPVPLGLRPADMDLESSNSGGGEEAARGGPLLRPRGLIATRSRKWLPPLAVVLERRGPTPHDRDGLGHASLMGQGWEEFSTGAEGGDKWCRVGEVPVADGLGGP